MLSRSGHRSTISDSALKRALGILVVLGVLWIAVAWAVAVP